MACVKSEDPLFEVEHDVDFEIPAGLNNIETHIFIINNVPTHVGNRLDDFNLTWDDVERINSAKATITGKFSNIDWDFVSSVEIDAINIHDHLDRKEIFYQEFIGFDTNEELRLLSSLSDIKSILENPTMKLEIQLRFKQFTPATLDTRFTYSFNVFGQGE